jgi:hypothetical protein
MNLLRLAGLTGLTRSFVARSSDKPRVSISETGLVSVTCRTSPKPKVAVSSSGVVTAYNVPLSYAFGGPEHIDPAYHVAPELRHYIDSENGLDTNSGDSPESAWRTFDNLNSAALGPGHYVLLKRGSIFDQYFVNRDLVGTAAQPIVFGAYGDTSLPRPRIAKSTDLNRSSHLMIRDLDLFSVSASDGANYINIFNNTVRGNGAGFELDYPSNGIKIFGPSHHIAVVSNFVYDVGANDAIVCHTDGDGLSTGDSFWIIDNIVIGNSGMEDGVDLATSELDDGDPTIAKDIKVIGNRIQMSAVSGISTLTGYGAKCINVGHEGTHMWVIGNTGTGSGGQAVKFGDGKDKIKFSGNLLFNNNLNESNPAPYIEALGTNLEIKHNTLLNNASTREVLNIGSTAGVKNIENNIFYSSSPIGTIFSGDATVAQIQNESSNYFLTDESITARFQLGAAVYDFFEWQALPNAGDFSQYDTFPNDFFPSYPQDPRDWDVAFFQIFLPQNINNDLCASQSNTVGAFTCFGGRLGLVIEPFDDLNENNGFGWDGPKLVKETLKRLGVTYSY